ncbi:alpha-hydroxyketone-type quorum-sensing autoinducer synthase [Nocardia sp. NPDC002869]|uniref:alpha-hydroxyketone-type quorum-sensing autoinducer synthase n=1 Tax=Nocardia sp. NPDC002869 TaxID=3161032 RepID=UPI00398CDF82
MSIHRVIADRIQRRVDRFHTERIAGDWGGQNILYGRAAGTSDVILMSNDYLALARDPRVTGAMSAALDGSGGMFASGALLHGEHPQLFLEKALAGHMRAPAGVLCQSGWDANVGLLQSIADAETPVYLDHFAHMSLWQGARIAGARIHLFRHNLSDHLRRQIGKYGPGVIAVDAIYSTNGSRCPLPQFCDIADETGSVLVVDESHSLGIDGPDGAGMVVDLGLSDRVHFRTASLSKAFAGRAGFVAANSAEFAAYFKMESYPAIFSSTLLPHDIAGLAAALDAIRTDEWRRNRLREVSTVLRQEMSALGFDLEGSASHIVALQTGPDVRAIAIRDFLQERGIFGAVFCPPATARHRTLIRFSLHAELRDSQIARIVSACAGVRDTFGVAPAAPTGI